MNLYRAKPQDGIVWVTGASSGIGRGVAQELARRGYRVAITARRGEELVELAARSGGKLFAYAGDVTDRAAMGQLVQQIEHDQGPIALAFLNVGMFLPDEKGVVAGDGTRKTFDVNLTGTLNCLEPLSAVMWARKCGQIAINASVAGFGGLPVAAAYNASKAALISLCESLKPGLEFSNIRLQVVNPGFVKTPLTHDNTFPMPFVLELDDAAKRICDGFERKDFEITFPKRLSWSLKFLNMLPYPVYFSIMRSMLRKMK